MSELASIHLNVLLSRIRELRNFDDDTEILPENETLLNEVADEIERKFSECSSNLRLLPCEDLSNLLDHLKKELSEVEGESSNVESEIEELSRKCMDDCNKLEYELEKLSCVSEFIGSQSPEKANIDMQMDDFDNADGQTHLVNAHDFKFKMLKLSHLVERKKTTLQSMQDLDSICERFQAVEKVEDALTGLRVIEIDESSIILSLNTYIPHLESVLRQQDIEGFIEPLELNHELIIETVDGTLELKHVKIFPNDVYIGEIVDAANSFRQLCPMFSVTETRSSLEWLVRRVQDRIALSSVRRFLVENVNKSRHSLEYLDKEDVIVAHVVGGIDAFIKLPQGWPLSDLAMEVISLKSTSQDSREISLSFLCRVVEMTTSLSTRVRNKITKFTDSIEEILKQQMRNELQHDGIAAKGPTRA